MLLFPLAAKVALFSCGSDLFVCGLLLLLFQNMFLLQKLPPYEERNHFCFRFLACRRRCRISGPLASGAWMPAVFAFCRILCSQWQVPPRCRYAWHLLFCISTLNGPHQSGETLGLLQLRLWYVVVSFFLSDILLLILTLCVVVGFFLGLTPLAPLPPFCV